MSIASNIQKRPGSSFYYARIEIPKELRQHYPGAGKKSPHRDQLWKSLKTRDPREARERGAAVIARWRAEFADLLRRREPTPTDLQAAVWSHYQEALATDQRSRARYPTAASLEEVKQKARAEIDAGQDPFIAAMDVLVTRDAAKLDRDRRAILLAEHRKHLATGETALIAAYADEVIERDGLLIVRGSPEWRDLCQRLQRAEIAGLERTIERDAGNFGGAPTDPIIVPPDPTMGKRFAEPGETIMELYDRFKTEKFGTARRDTWDQNRKIVRLFAEFIGDASHISAITRKAVRNWKHELARWPVKAADIKAFKGLSFRKVIEANATLGKPTIGEKTINKYLSAVGSFATWLLQNDYLNEDVMTGLYLVVNKREKKRYPFTAEQLSTIFRSPLFNRCVGDGQEHRLGKVEIRDWRYWMPWIALYTGARLGEIAQLLTTDVRQLHGVWIFHITEIGDEDDQKSTKTGGSQRVVPIHRELIKLGFLAYHDAMRARGEKRLFPEVERDTRGYFGDASKFFNDHFRALGVKVDKRVNFHSFRHGIADAFRAAGYIDEQFNVLLGHTKATTTGKYGILPQGILSQRVEMIEAVRF